MSDSPPLWPAPLRCGLLIALVVSQVVAPSDAQVVIRSSLIQENAVAVGGTHEGTIQLYNQGDSSRTAEVSLRDYLFTHRGSSQYLEPGSHDRSNAPWINYGASRVTIPPGEETTIRYDVQVPEPTDGETPVGTYWSMIIVEPLDQNPNAETEQGLAVQQVRRYGIQIATHIQNTGSPDLEILNTDLVSEEDQTQLRLSLENTGTRSDSPGIRLEMYNDENGELVLERTSSPKLIYPSTSVAHRFDLAGLSSGEYQALIVIESESGRPTGVQLSIEL